MRHGDYGPLNAVVTEVLLFGGGIAEDPRGGTLAIGGLANLINPAGNVITIEDFHFMSRITAPAYRRSENWHRHERRHEWQCRRLRSFYLPLYAVGAVVGAIYELASGVKSHGPLGHDHNPMEIDAINQERGRTHRNPLDPIIALRDLARILTRAALTWPDRGQRRAPARS